MKIDSTEIEYFLEVAKQESFTAAAEVLYVSQPAVSRKVCCSGIRLLSCGMALLFMQMFSAQQMEKSIRPSSASVHMARK